MVQPCVWGPVLGEEVWRSIERLQMLMLSRMIRSKPSVPCDIIQAEFEVAPLVTDALFQIVSYIQHVYSLDRDRLLQLAVDSSM